MKRIIYAISLLLTVGTLAYGQQTVEGRVLDADNNAPLIGAYVIVQGTTDGTETDFEGEFSIDVPKGHNILEVEYLGYATQEVNLDTWDGTVRMTTAGVGLGEIVVVGKGVIDLEEDRVTPIAVTTIRQEEIQQKAVGNVEFPEVMKNVPSVYASNQVGFGDSQMFLRGFSQSNTAFLLNGQPINGMEDGRMYWSNWSGMTDIANAVQVQRGLGSSKLAISSVGGTVNIVTKATEKTQGGFVRALVGNDNFYKFTGAYNTGLTDSGWGLSILLDHWQGDRKYDEGTKGQGQNYFVSIGKKAGDHNFNFMVFGAPQWHMQKWSQSLDVLNNYRKYNQHWGIDTDGVIESERTNFYHKPVLNLNWDWEINDNSNLSTVLYGSFGRGGGTGPRGNGLIRQDEYEFVNGGDTVRLDGQIDYQAIRDQNDEIGVGGDYTDPLGAGYIRRASMNNHQWFGLVSNYGIGLTENLDLNVGADFRFYTGDHFRQIVNLYGLSGWSNDRPDGKVVDATFSFNPWSTFVNYANEDQRINYDYSEDINYQGVFGQLEYATDMFSVFAQGSLSNQSYQRENRFATDDNGNQTTETSDKASKIGYNVKGGASFSVTPENTFYANAGFYSRQPFLDNIFSGTAELAEPAVENEEILGLEAGYRLKTSSFIANLNLYRTEWANRFIAYGQNIIDASTGEELDVAREQTDVTQVHSGIELDVQYLFNDVLRIGGYASFGNWIFAGTTPYQTRDYRDNTTFENSEVSNYTDRDGNPLPENFFDGEVDLDGVKLGNAPQTSFGLNARYNIIKNLNVGVDWNFYTNLFEFVDVSDVVQQGNDYEVTKMDSYNVLDFTAGYTLDLGNNALEFRANVYNVLNSTFLNQSDAFGYFMGNGTTWNGSVAFRF